MKQQSFLVNVSGPEDAPSLNIIEFVNGGESLRMHPETGSEAKDILKKLIGTYSKGEI